MRDAVQWRRDILCCRCKRARSGREEKVDEGTEKTATVDVQPRDDLKLNAEKKKKSTKGVVEPMEIVSSAGMTEGGKITPLTYGLSIDSGYR